MRPAFEALQQAIFSGAIKTVVVWKLDRISRRQLDGVSVLADWCERGIRVASVTQQIDLRGAVGRMVAHLRLQFKRDTQPTADDRNKVRAHRYAVATIGYGMAPKHGIRVGNDGPWYWYYRMKFFEDVVIGSEEM